MIKSTPYNKTQQYINVAQEKRIPSLLTHKQIILLYLKYENPILNYKDFCNFYKIKQRIFNIHINRLEQEHIIKLKKRGKPNTYQLNTSPQMIKIFESATEQEHQQVYEYLVTNNTKLQDAVNIILNQKALELLHDLQKSEQITHFYKKKPTELSHLIKYNTVKKLAPKLYTLSQNYNSEKFKIDQLDPKNKNAINNIICNTHFSDCYNIHNITLSISNINYQDFHINPFEKPLKPIEILVRYEHEPQTYITAHIFPNNTLSINIGCSRKPILVNDTIRLNFMLVAVFEALNDRIGIPDYYRCDYDNVIVNKHDYAIDGITFSPLPKDYKVSYTNQTGEILELYVKESSEFSSWLRIEERRNNTKYTLPEFRNLIQSRTLNINPSS